MRLPLSLALILGLCGMAQAQNTLSERVTLAHGSFSSGGGLTIAVELRRAGDRTALCGAWSESRSQSSYTTDEARRIVRLASVYVEGRWIAQDLGFMPRIPPQLDYAGASARCVLTALHWHAGHVPEVFVPRQQIGTVSRGDPNITFRQTGAGAMEHALEIVPFLTRNSRLLRLSRAARVAEGRYSSGGGVRVVAEIVSVNGRAHLCGVWSDLPGQVTFTEPLGREILRRGSAVQGERIVVKDLSGLRQVRARDDYRGVNASCLDTGAPWIPAHAQATLNLRLPSGVVYRSTTTEGRQVIQFES